MSKHDPTKTLTKVAQAESQCRSRLKQAKAEVLALIKPALATNAEYSFTIDEGRLLELGATIKEIIDQRMQEGAWLFEQFVKPAYMAGTGRAYINIAAQSAAYKATVPQLTNVLMSPPYQARIGLVRARVFEEMAGFSGDLGNKLAATLARGVGNGFGAAKVAAEIAQNFDVTEYRALRIARTEITTALRRARMDESDAASSAIGLEIKLMHISAFAATSRKEHMARHGALHTSDEQRLWWSMDGNSVNCLCSIIEVVIGANGQPLAPGLITRAQQIKDKNT
jgi:hypothetical protein